MSSNLDEVFSRHVTDTPFWAVGENARSHKSTEFRLGDALLVKDVCSEVVFVTADGLFTY